jgi:hypothetical protein
LQFRHRELRDLHFIAIASRNHLCDLLIGTMMLLLCLPLNAWSLHAGNRLCAGANIGSTGANALAHHRATTQQNKNHRPSICVAHGNSPEKERTKLLLRPPLRSAELELKNPYRIVVA